jgi:S-methylmethionine-dependent homocysteine/selenocysteine methylase
LAIHRDSLPQLGDRLFLTDGGLETVLIFHQGFDLPCFASFPLLEDERGRAVLRSYLEPYIDVAAESGTGLILDSVTWRANAAWGEQLGYSADSLADVNRRAVEAIEAVREERGSAALPMVLSGCVGPRGDGYVPGETMSADEAADYHAVQIGTLAATSADMIGAATLSYADEAIGIVRAAGAAGMPSVISFTVETDGRLATGQPLSEAISQVDTEADGGPAYYMINCAHPTHYAPALEPGAAWADRVRGLRSNASRMSHAELDEATELDDGNPDELGAEHRALRERFPKLSVMGGCCGTDHRHIAAIARACR